MDEPIDQPCLAGLPKAAQALTRAVDSVRKQLSQDAGVSLSELRALSRIADTVNINPKSLALDLDLGGPAVTAITDALVHRNLVVRKDHPADRRKLILQLTPAGQQIVDSTYESFSAAILGAAGDLPPASVRDLAATISHLASELERDHERPAVAANIAAN